MPARPRSSLALAGAADAEEAIAVGDLVIESPWARTSIGTSRPGAAYFRVRNTGTTDDVLTAVETPAAHMAEMHATDMKDGVVSMVPVETLEISAGGEAALKPGGTHVTC
jgi:copper(I)-binding protein